MRKIILLFLWWLLFDCILLEIDFYREINSKKWKKRTQKGFFLDFWAKNTPFSNLINFVIITARDLEISANDSPESGDSDSMLKIAVRENFFSL